MTVLLKNCRPHIWVNIPGTALYKCECGKVKWKQTHEKVKDK
jgi:hypothetical protein